MKSNLQHKSVFILLVVFLTVSQSYSQITFDKGYYINNRGTKIECLIKNYDWGSTPTKINFKLQEDSEVKTIGIDSVKEFGVDNYCRYVRADVKIDRSPTELRHLDSNKKPIWSEETLFLKELVYGKVGLWIYTESARSLFFYTIENSTPQQLVCKEYLLENQIVKNDNFKQQITSYIQNENTKSININSLRYDEKSLTKYFNTFNSKINLQPKNDSNKPIREVFNVKAFGALNYSTLQIAYPTFWYIENDNFGNKINWMGGLEMEYFLPSYRNSWSLLLVPTYEKIIFIKESSNTTRMLKKTSIEFPFGGRYTIYAKNQSEYFFDLYLNPPVCVNFGSEYDYNEYNKFKITGDINAIFGAGYAYKNLRGELKFHSNRQLSDNYNIWITNYTKFSLSISYKLFNLKSK